LINFPSKFCPDSPKFLESPLIIVVFTSSVSYLDLSMQIHKIMKTPNQNRDMLMLHFRETMHVNEHIIFTFYYKLQKNPSLSHFHSNVKCHIFRVESVTSSNFFYVTLQPTFIRISKQTFTSCKIN
jgi:hypothetical protein